MGILYSPKIYVSLSMPSAGIEEVGAKIIIWRPHRFGDPMQHHHLPISVHPFPPAVTGYAMRGSGDPSVGHGISSSGPGQVVLMFGGSVAVRRGHRTVSPTRRPRDLCRYRTVPWFREERSGSEDRTKAGAAVSAEDVQDPNR